MNDFLQSQLLYIFIILGVILLPKLIQRFKIPSPLTCFTFGVVVSLMTTQFNHDLTIGLLSIFGISSLFLFAGLEVNLYQLKGNLTYLLTHLTIRSSILIICAWIGVNVFGLPWQVSALICLAVLTPSTGFILDSLPTIGLNKEEQFWVTSKAIAGEILALMLLFIVLKGESIESLLGSFTVLIGLIICIPFLFIILNKFLIPHAPDSEFSMLIVVGVIAASITKEIGVYYLVGAFLAGAIVGHLKHKVPNFASERNLSAIKLFASFFVPFYFFYSGIKVPASIFSLGSISFGIALSFILIPLRILTISVQRMIIHKDSFKTSLSISTALTPTLIFTLVISTILYEKFNISEELFGALLIYAGITTLIPIWILPKPYNMNIT